MIQGGFTSHTSILKRMKKRGWLDTEDNKLTRRKKISLHGSLTALNIIIDQAELYEKEPLTMQEKEALEEENKRQDKFAKRAVEIVNSED
ncbi:MAG: hypothetical protein ACLRY5_10995 [Zhenhengia sp.]